MFSIEHEFDSTVIILVDEGTAQLQEDLIVNSFSECVSSMTLGLIRLIK